VEKYSKWIELLAVLFCGGVLHLGVLLLEKARLHKILTTSSIPLSHLPHTLLLPS
jgi:Flp pilus assembly protein protease CpaA